MEKIWTRESVSELLEKSDVAVVHGIIAIYKLQTEDEKMGRTARVQNGMGFSKMDAEFGSSLAESAMKNGTLSEKQLVYARKMCKKYIRQLVELSNSKK